MRALDVKAPASGATDPARGTEQKRRPEYDGELKADQASLWLSDRLRGWTKGVIVWAACWGLPASWATWLIQRGGLAHA